MEGSLAVVGWWDADGSELQEFVVTAAEVWVSEVGTVEEDVGLVDAVLRPVRFG